MLIETPANPTIVMTDIRRIANCAAERARTAARDGRQHVSGSAFQHPLALGADVSLYSATKYLGGFSDIIGGVAYNGCRPDAQDSQQAQSVRQHSATG